MAVERLSPLAQTALQLMLSHRSVKMALDAFAREYYPPQPWKRRALSKLLLGALLDLKTFQDSLEETLDTTVSV